MIPVTTQRGKKLALFGLGGSGLVTAQALVAGGAEVIAFDDNPQKVKEAEELGIPTGDLRSYDFSTCDALVLAPGVPLTHPKPHWTVELAHNHNVPVIGDVELFAGERRAQAPNSQFIAITGTNGKSTTTALIAHILKNAGRNVQMGGNIGKAVLSLDPLSDDAVYVVECSSYQIDLASKLDPTIGILLNLAPDHLDRHGTMDGYAEIKSRLVSKSARAIVGVDDVYSREIADRIDGAVSISVVQALEFGVYASGTQVSHAEPNGISDVASLENAETLRGKHNAQNASAAWAACHIAGLSDQDIQKGLNTFPGLAHRMEIIGHIGDIVFVNDSKATNADAAAMALSSFEKIHWIAGGLPKDGGIEALRPLFGRVAKAYLIGEAAPEFAASLGTEVPFVIAETLDKAVYQANADASRDNGEAVLLSPACASFDQYANFELRGEAFREEVTKLDGFKPYGDNG
ncbi:MAG: UDP-N-acetylmuramoyl-L-alanine--D-glutamate ligase [Rhizobiaceae bacterium]|nr:UDP-N-acetylmuramoyl-L-alanine--D-glutamate ligase [Rhizobiaceae bacterium]